MYDGKINKILNQKLITWNKSRPVVSKIFKKEIPHCLVLGQDSEVE